MTATLPHIGARNHGYGPYTRGCRCPICRRAKSDYMRARRAQARRRANIAAEAGVLSYVPCITHGRSGFREQGCRCLLCRSAVAIEAATLRKQRAVGQEYVSREANRGAA